MTGPEHYAEAERLLAGSLSLESSGDPHLADTMRLDALVHGVLAVAAGIYDGRRSDADRPNVDRP